MHYIQAEVLLAHYYIINGRFLGKPLPHVAIILLTLLQKPGNASAQWQL